MATLLTSTPAVPLPSTVSDRDFILGLMRDNYEAVGFLPTVAVEEYLSEQRFVLQSDERGRPVGYLIHGPIRYGLPVQVVQHCIDREKRLEGFGQSALRELIERAAKGNAAGIKLRCAVDLPSLGFWQRQGFEVVSVVAGGKRRKRQLARMYLAMEPLFAKGISG